MGTWSAVGRPMRKVAVLGAVTCVGAAVVVGMPGTVAAEPDPVAGIVHPARDPAAVMPTPLADPFYTPARGFENLRPGAVVAARVVDIGPEPTPVTATELLIRSTDAKGRPVPVVATLLMPIGPWEGSGRRPLVAYNVPIDSLGNLCAPSQQLRLGLAAGLRSVQLSLSKNYAVIVPDHQGPRQAYAAGRMAGHAVLDSIRAAVQTPELGLSPDAPTVVSGYSGGAIASGWAAQLAPEYAGELNLVGAVVGGVPADFGLLINTMNGANAASGVFLAATLGLAREYPEIMGLFNDNGWRLSQFAKDLCFLDAALLGVLAPITVETLTDVAHPTELPMVREILAENRLGTAAPRVPVLLYHGINEVWIPFAGAEHLYDDWCRLGVPVRFEAHLGEHLIVADTGGSAANSWIDQRFTGAPEPVGCSKVSG
ncbi:lipase family protein [Nocardia pseudovaccinii]|uniref:lipase family protein n=1 Tax=Nocardia pseudovaccinii TaxID=189540 RepID=UPI001FDFA172|nr:lipase family protein [Nocardia pseudovaccinii]